MPGRSSQARLYPECGSDEAQHRRRFIPFDTKIGSTTDRFEPCLPTVPTVCDLLDRLECALRMVFRGMEPGPNGLPLLGRSSRKLGVRVPGDITPDSAGNVHPGMGGMSVALATMWNLPNHRRPRGMLRGSTGPAGDRVYGIEPEVVADHSLFVCPTSIRHANVEPSIEMSLASYESNLVRTQPSWVQVWP